MKSTAKKSFLLLAFLLAGLLPQSLWSACRVTESKWGEYRSIVMENDLVRVTILPDSNGSITEYLLKKGDFNVIVPVENPKFSLLEGVALVDSNFGGYKDFCLETGVIKSERSYTCKITENSKERVAVLASFSSSARIDRLMTLADNSTVLEIEVNITNISENPVTYSYWMHTMIAPAGKIDNREVFCIPVGANQTSTRNTGCFKSETDTVAEVVNTANACASVAFYPKQGWKGVLSKKAKAVYAEIMPVDQLIPDGYFDFWKGQKGGELGNPVSLLTSETVFSAKTIKPKENLKIKLALIQTLGLAGLSSASRNLCISVSPKEFKTTGEPLTVELNSPRVFSGKLSFALIGKNGALHPLAAEHEVALDPTQATVLKISPGNVSAEKGSYGLRYTLKDAQGQLLEESDLLGVKITKE